MKQQDPINQKNHAKTVKDILIEHFKSLKKIPSLVKGVSEEQFTLDNQFIELKLVYDDQKLKNEPIQIYQLLNQLGEEPTHNQRKDKALGVVIKGGPGAGKSILMNKIAYQWAVHQQRKAQDKDYKSQRREFDYVLRLNLKTIISKKDDIKKGKQVLYSFLYESIEALSLNIEWEEFVKQILSVGKQRLLILLDGYDEVSHVQGEDGKAGKVLADLMRQVKQFNTVITSRPEAVQRSAQLKDYQRVIEVQQLEEKTILTFIQAIFKSNKNNIQKMNILTNTIRQKRNILRMIKSPLNLTMVCLLLISEKQNALTIQDLNQIDLYHKIIWLIVQRFELDKPITQKGHQDRRDLQRELRNQTYKCQPLQYLKELIFTVFTAGKITINYDQIYGYCQAKGNKQRRRDVFRFGLLKQSTNVKEQKKHQQQSYYGDYQFIHLSFAEYLVAETLYQKLKSNTLQEKYSETAEFIAQRRYEPTYFNTFRYLTMFCSKDYYSSKANELPLETISTCFTCNIDSTLQFGNQKRIRLLIEMISLSEKFRKNYPGKPHLIKAAEDFIARIFNLEEEDQQSREKNTQLLIRWYNYFIDSEYLPAFLIEQLSKKTKLILQNLDKKQTVSLSKIQEELIKAYCELSSSLIYLKIWNQKQKQSAIRTFYKLIQQTKSLPLRLLALTDLRKLQVYLSQEQLQTIFITDKLVEVLLACLKEKIVHKQSFALILACQKRIPIEKQGNTLIRVRVLQQLKHIMSDQKSQIEEALILEQLYNQKVQISRQPNTAKLKSQICLIYVKRIKQRKLDGSDPIKINGVVRKDMFSILKFLIKDESAHKLLELNQYLLKMDKKNTECQIKIKADQDISQWQSEKIVKDLREILQQQRGSYTKDQLQERQVFYLRNIPDGFGKYVKKNSLFKLLKIYQTQNIQSKEIWNITLISIKVINHLQLKQREQLIILQLFQTLSKKEKTSSLSLPAIFSRINQSRISNNTTAQVVQTYIVPHLKNSYGDVLRQAVQCICYSLSRLKLQSMDNFIENHIVPLLITNDYKVRIQALECIRLSLPRLKQQSIVKLVETHVVPHLKDRDQYVPIEALKFISQSLPKLKQQNVIKLVNTHIVPYLGKQSWSFKAIQYAFDCIRSSLLRMKQSSMVEFVQKHIIPLLKHFSPQIRSQAMKSISYTLSRLQQQSMDNFVEKHIVPRLIDDDYNVRSISMECIRYSLKRLKQQSMVKFVEKHIIPLLKHQNYQLHTQAVQYIIYTLSMLKYQSVDKFVDEHIVPLLNNQKNQLRLLAFRIICKSLPHIQQIMNNHAKKYVFTFLKQKDSYQNWYFLDGFQDIQSMSLFLQRLKLQNVDNFVEEFILPLLKYNNYNARKLGLRCVSQFIPRLKLQSIDNFVYKHIFPLLEDTQPLVRSQAIQYYFYSLQSLKFQSVDNFIEKHIVPHLTDKEIIVRQSAIKLIRSTLPRLKQQNMVKLVETDIVPQLVCRQGKVDIQALKCISQFFLSRVKQQRMVEFVEKHIISFLKHFSPQIRSQAMKSISYTLSRLQQQSMDNFVEKHIVPRLKHFNDMKVRIQGLECIRSSLPRLKQQSVLKLVEKHVVPHLKDYSDSKVRIYALDCIRSSLPRLKQQSVTKFVENIIPLLKDKDQKMREGALAFFLSAYQIFFQFSSSYFQDKIVTSLIECSAIYPQLSFNATLRYLHKFLALAVDKNLSSQGYMPNIKKIENEIMKISKTTLSISQLHEQAKIIQVVDNLIRLNFDHQTIQYFCSLLFQNSGILERQYEIIRDKLRVHQFLNTIVINRIRKDEQRLSGVNYKALVELSKANAKVYDTILQMYKIPLEQTYRKVKQQGENSQTLRAIRQQLKNKQLDIHSYFAQKLLEKLIVLAIEDQEISEQDADLIYFCVQSNLTITFTYTPNTEPNDFRNNFQHSYAIVLAGKTYPVRKGLKQYFGLLRKLFDRYGKLYAIHKPQFTNDGKHGLKKAAIDVAEVREVFIDHKKILTSNSKLDRFIDWNKAIIIELEQGQQRFYLLSRRDEFGNINITKMQLNKETCFILNSDRLDNQTLRRFKQEVIGSIQDNFYQLSVFSAGKITVLPKNKQQLQEKVIKDLQCFKQLVSKWKLLGEKVRPQEYRARDVQNIQQILDKTGIAKKSSFIKQLQELEKGRTEEQKSKIKNYSRTALFKLHYIVESFSLLSAGLLQRNKDFRFKDEVKYTDLAKKIVETASEYIDMLPMFGDFVTKVTDFVKSKLQERQERQQSNQMVVFLKIFRQNSSDPSDQALLVQEVALQLTKLRKAYLLSGKEKQEQNLTLFPVFNQIKDQIAEIGLQKELKGQDQVDQSAILACADVITFVMSIVNKKQQIMEMQFKRENIVQELMRLFSEQHERDKREEAQEQQGCFGRTKYCLYLYENCLCKKKDIAEQFEGLSCFEKFKRYVFACFCCFKCCESPRNPYRSGQSKPSKTKEKNLQLDNSMRALSSWPNSRQDLIKQSSASPRK